MLTPTDVHYVVGLLSRASNPDDVEIELGDYVFDEASDTKRDVDVTMTSKNADGTRSALMGIEVKSHTRPLGTDHVEQLIQKLRDMPSITHRGIVSASGFTGPAINKAAHHQVDLYELRDWQSGEGFDYFRPTPQPAVRETYGWVGDLAITINPGEAHSIADKAVLGDNPQMRFGDPSAEPHDLKRWLDQLGKLAAKEANSRVPESPREGNQDIPANVTVNLNDAVYAESHGATILIKAVCYEGTVQRRIEQMPSVLKAMFKLGDSVPLAGCAITDFGDLGLVALIVSNRRTIEMGFVPLSDRNKQKIYQHRLGRRMPSESKES